MNWVWMAALMAALVCHATATSACLAGSGFPIQARQTLDLSGTWQVRLDRDQVGRTQGWPNQVQGQEVTLPGTCNEFGIGDAVELTPGLNKKTFQHLQPKFRFIGEAWYSRTIELPATWQSGPAILHLERVIWKSEVWINGNRVGERFSLSTPHQYWIGRHLKPGLNTIVVCIDNRAKADLGEMAHAYSEQTQTIWNGIIGDLSIQTIPDFSIDEIQTVGIQVDDDVARSVRIRVTVNNHTSDPHSTGLKLSATPVSGQTSRWESRRQQVELQPGKNEFIVSLTGERLHWWSEFSPHLYNLRCTLGEHTKTIVTGFRRVQNEKKNLLINGRQSFMRGTLECCQFPLTGYPAMNVDAWSERFAVARKMGLNHIRFHSWCPPEAAFLAADQAGIYLQVELPNWSAKMGLNERVDRYLKTEANRIFERYGHHPSFVFFSLGNELKGDFNNVDPWLSEFRDRNPHVLMTSTSFSFSDRGKLPGRQDDFFVTQRTADGWVRGQGVFNSQPPTTDADFGSALDSIAVPLISHEIGQYCVFPDLQGISKYQGNLWCPGLEAVAADLESKQRLPEAEQYTRNSARVAFQLYKEEIERAMRTPGQAGFQLLGLQDFMGQGTATVGLLDVFWDPKPGVEFERFRNFCAPVVPLLRMSKRCWRAGEVFTADLQVANFGDQPLPTSGVQWTLQHEGEPIASGQLAASTIPLGNRDRLEQIEFTLPKFDRPLKLEVLVTIQPHDASNRWSIWVFPEARDVEPGKVKVFRELSNPMWNALQAGESVLLIPNKQSAIEPIAGRFVPVFWSPLHFPNQPTAMGTVIRNDHDCFNFFPTESHSDWQWWALLKDSYGVDIDLLELENTDARELTIMQFIDRFNRNARPGLLWECQVGPGKLFVSTLDLGLDSDHAKAERQWIAIELQRSVLSYMNSDSFAPRVPLSRAQLETVFRSASQ